MDAYAYYADADIINGVDAHAYADADAFGTASTQLILDAMLQHIDDVCCCEAALSATARLAGYQADQADIAEAFMIYGAPARIVAVMRRHPHLLSIASEAAQTLCFWGPDGEYKSAFMRLWGPDGEYKAAFMRVGGGDLFVTVDPSLQEKLARVLARQATAIEAAATAPPPPQPPPPPAARPVVVRGLAIEQAVAIARAVATRAHAAAATAAAAVGRCRTMPGAHCSRPGHSPWINTARGC